MIFFILSVSTSSLVVQLISLHCEINVLLYIHNGMYLPSTLLFIGITIRYSDYTCMAPCFDPHLGDIQASILHKINDSCMLNVPVDRLRS